MLNSVAPVTWLTQEVHARLKAELAELPAARASMAESSERMAAEERIRHLMAMLKNVNIHAPADAPVAWPGGSVRVRGRCPVIDSGHGAVNPLDGRIKP
jgi:transcription elongation factor GreA